MVPLEEIIEEVDIIHKLEYDNLAETFQDNCYFYESVVRDQKQRKVKLGELRTKINLKCVKRRIGTVLRKSISSSIKSRRMARTTVRLNFAQGNWETVDILKNCGEVMETAKTIKVDITKRDEMDLIMGNE